jgi:hypothetical protein
LRRSVENPLATELLADHFTISSLLEAIRTHLLATAVLIFTPSLWRRYRT